MKWTEAIIPTLREAPADAEIASHQLLIRAGLVRKLTSGVYIFMPLGLKVLRKVETIIRQEMDAAGALEILMPALQPEELWKQGPRYEAAQRVMFRATSATGRAGEAGTFLGPTHEEVVTDLIANTINSHRQLPRTLYQIQTKFRDEIRPRFGLMRAREFVMKDAYSFDRDKEGALVSYAKMYAAYEKIFSRLGLRAIPVQADTGVMGGDHSHEFSVPCSVGESEIVFTEDGSYRAAIEKAVSQPLARSNPASCPVTEKFPTPGVVTIEALAQQGVSAQDQIKTLVYVADSKTILLLLRGDHRLCEEKVGALGFGQFRAATDKEIVDALGAHPGSLGAVGIKSGAKIAAIYADDALQDQRGMVTGANEDGFHLRHVDVSRDIAPTRFVSLRTAQEGELSTDGKPLKVARAIEVGHVFYLGTKYSDAFGAKFLDENGASQPIEMGCYGIGVTRCLQAIVEQNHDSNGIIWPAEVAPYDVLMLLLDKSLATEAQTIQSQLEQAGFAVLLDDRDERPGVKFKDADLLGIPQRITLGEKSWKAGGIELRSRATGQTTIVKPDQLIQTLQA